MPHDGSDNDVCLTPDTNKANPHYGTAGQDLGIKTFPGEDWKLGGGTGWGWYMLRSGHQARLLLDGEPRTVEPMVPLPEQDP